MNFIVVSPHFPRTYWNFCDRLKKMGVRVLGIGDAPYDSLAPEVTRSLDEYYYLPNMESYEEMRRAVAFFASKYGRIHWIESNNEYWLEQDARLRQDFNIKTGVQPDEVRFFKSKAEMKIKYAQANVPTARCAKVENWEQTAAFLEAVGFPAIAKPEKGVGAAHTYKLESLDDVRRFFEEKPDEPYVCEEFITGDVYSYDAITDANATPLFESSTVWPPSIADIVNKGLDLAYYVNRDDLPKLYELGRRTAKAFNAFNRFIHLEFFRLTQPKKNLADVGDFVALEVNTRPAGGYTPDMMNFAHSVDVYQIWAEMVVNGVWKDDRPRQNYYCAYASRKDGKRYAHTHEEILDRYGAVMKMCEEMPEMMHETMGRQMYPVRVDTKEEVDEFIRFVHERE